MMEGRRALILTVACGMVWMPRAAEAQPPSGKPARIGYLGFHSGPSLADEGFRQGLRELGYVEGKTIVVEYRWAGLKPERASALAAELVRLNVDVLVSVTGPVPALAAKSATTTIPIVFEAADPVKAGLVTRLDRPGGNLTGVENFFGELNAKRLELLKEVVPGISRVGVLANPAGRMTARRLKEIESTARALRVKLLVQEARELQEIDAAFAAMARERAEGLLVLTDPMFSAQRERIVDLAAKRRLPGIFYSREFAEAGGLLSYNSNLADTRRRLAAYVDKILKGAKPGDLPVEQPTKFEMIVNLKTAKGLGLIVPPSILLRVDKTIE